MRKMLVFAILFVCFGIFAQTAGVRESSKEPAEPLDVAAAVKLLESKEQAFEKLANTNPKKGTPKYAAKDREVKQIVEDLVDYRFISEYIIGKKWG